MLLFCSVGRFSHGIQALNSLRTGHRKQIQAAEKDMPLFGVDKLAIALVLPWLMQGRGKLKDRLKC